MSIGPVEDRLAIRELVETFAVGIMRKDIAVWGSTWAEDCTWNVPLKEEPVVGKSNIIAVLQEVLARNNFVSINSFPTETVIDGDKARGKRLLPGVDLSQGWRTENPGRLFRRRICDELRALALPVTYLRIPVARCHTR